MGTAESQDRAVFRIALTQDEQRIVNAERDCHPDSHVRRKMLVRWLLRCGLTRPPRAGTFRWDRQAAARPGAVA
jgi:hypothetical protein